MNIFNRHEYVRNINDTRYNACLSNIPKIYVYLRSSCNLSMYSESLLLPPDGSPEGEGRSSVVFAESIKSSLNDQAPDVL